MSPLTPPTLRPPTPPSDAPSKWRVTWASLLGKPAVDGVVGWQMQKFSVTTDGSGQATITLRSKPSALNQCFCLIAEAERHIEPISLAGKVLTIQKRKHLYDRTQLNIHAGHIIENAVSAVALGAFNTGDTAPSASSSAVVTTTTAPGGGGGGNVIDSVSVAVTTTVAAHHHTVDKLPDHGHQVAYDLGHSLDTAPAEVTEILVIYQ